MKSGRPLYYLPDLDYGRKESIFVPFFGVPAATITGLPRLARLANAAVVPCVVRMGPGGEGYVLELGAPWADYPSDDVDADTRRMNAWLEGVIRKDRIMVDTLMTYAYSGDASSQQQRFPYSKQYESRLKAAGHSAYARALAFVQQAPAQHLQISTNPIDELKGRDQALVVSLVLNSETVSVESFGGVRKLFILIRGQALFFDFKSMTAVRSYPLSFAFIDNLRHEPSLDVIKELVT